MVKRSTASSSSSSGNQVVAFLKLTPHHEPHHFYEVSTSSDSARSVSVRFGRSGRKGRTLTVACKSGISPRETALRLAARRLRSAPGWHLYDPANRRSRKSGNPLDAISRAIRALRQQRTSKKAKPSAGISKKRKSSAKKSTAPKSAAPKSAAKRLTRSSRSAPHISFSSPPAPMFSHNPQTPDGSGIYHYPGSVRPNSQPALLEIVFSFDTTGSMVTFLNDIRSKLRTILTQLLADLPFIRISIIAHGDWCDSRSSYVLKMLDLSNDTDQIVKFVSGVSSTGGGDSDECYELVLQEAVDKTSWSPASAKALVVIGDANPHPPNTYKRIDWRAELARLKAKNVRVYGVHADGGYIHAKAFYETIAKETGGAYLTLDRVDTLREMILGLCYLEATEQQGQQITDSGVSLTTLASSSSDVALPSDVAGALDSEAADITRVVGDEMEVDTSTSADDSSTAPARRLSDEDVMRIHSAIHSRDTTTDTTKVTIDSEEHTVSVGSAGCRFVRVNGTTFIEQNKLKDSRFAKMALDEGKKITWVVRRGRWGLIIDDQIVRR